MQVQFLSQEDSPGGGPSNPLQYSSLKNPMYRGVWQAIVYEVSKNCTWQVTLHTGTHSEKIQIKISRGKRGTEEIGRAHV